MKITAFVRRELSASDCKRTRYLESFSTFGGCNDGNNAWVAFNVNSRKTGLESLKPLQSGSNTDEFKAFLLRFFVKNPT